MNTTAPAARSAGCLDHLELSLVEFCQLVDFLLDIVSLVSFLFHVHLTFTLTNFHSLLLFHCFISTWCQSILFLPSILSFHALQNTFN